MYRITQTPVLRLGDLFDLLVITFSQIKLYQVLHYDQNQAWQLMEDKRQKGLFSDALEYINLISYLLCF